MFSDAPSEAREVTQTSDVVRWADVTLIGTHRGRNDRCSAPW